MAVVIGIARETAPGERRVALTPETAKKLAAAGATVRVERGLGDSAHLPDKAYADAATLTVGEGWLQAEQGRFSPQAPVTRAEVAQVLAKVVGLQPL